MMITSSPPLGSVSINSTSEEVRSNLYGDVESDGAAALVSINSTSEEVRSGVRWFLSNAIPDWE